VFQRWAVWAALALAGVLLGAPAVLAQDAAGAPAGEPAASSSASSSIWVERISYNQYLAQHAGAPTPEVEIAIPAAAFTAKSADMEADVLVDAYGRPGESLLTGERGWVEWTVEVPEAGWYSIEIDYYPAPGRGTSIEREIQINGEVLFSGAELLVFHRIFGDEGPFLKDIRGNEIRPRQVEKPMWRTVFLSDSLGYVRGPYQFYLREGENTIRLISRAEPMVIGELRIKQPPRIRPYAEVRAEYERAGYRPTQGHMIVVQGEHATLRSSPALFPVFDQGDPTTEPYHPAEIRLNSIGGHRWQVLGDWIVWEVEVPEDGLYEISIKAKQNLNRGTFSNRRIFIDGQVPFAELEAVPFNYSSRYEMKRLGLDFQDEPFLFYLTKGKHEIRMEAVLGDLAPLVAQSEEVLYELNSIYRSIIMITSATPDPMRTYNLEQRVPGLLRRLAEQSEIIKGIGRPATGDHRRAGRAHRHAAGPRPDAGPDGGPARPHPQYAAGVPGRHRQPGHVDHGDAQPAAPDRLPHRPFARRAASQGQAHVLGDFGPRGAGVHHVVLPRLHGDLGDRRRVAGDVRPGPPARRTGRPRIPTPSRSGSGLAATRRRSSSR